MNPREARLAASSWSFLARSIRARAGLVAFAGVVLLQFVPHGGVLPWGGIWSRLQTRELVFAERLAHEGVMAALRQRARELVEQRHPEAPEARKHELADTALGELTRRAAAEVRDEVRQAAVEIREHYRYEHAGRRYPYMPDIDPYRWVRYARNVLEHGRYSDELRDGVPFDSLMNGPAGAPIPGINWHVFVLAGLHRLVRLLDPSVPLLHSAQYFPVLAVLACMVPAFGAGRRLGGLPGGVIAATVIATTPAIMARTLWGHPDTDAYNVFFPLVVVWLLLEAVRARDIGRRVCLAGLAGLGLVLYSRFWIWVYLFDAVIVALVATIAVYGALALGRAEPRDRQDSAGAARSLAIIAGAFLVPVLGLLGPIETGLQAVALPLEILKLRDAARPDLWPNVYATVAELTPGSLQATVAAIGGPALFSLALIGIVLTFFVHQSLFPAVLLLCWFGGTFYASVRGVRFALLFGPAFALACAAFAGGLHALVRENLARAWPRGARVLSVAPVLVSALPLIWPGAYTGSAGVLARNDVPGMDSAWGNTLTAIREGSSPRAIVTAWWDFGHHIEYVAERRVNFDPANQNSPVAHWVGRLLLTGDEMLSIGLLRMLDCAGNEAFELLARATPSPTRSAALLDRVVVADRVEAARLLRVHGLSGAVTEAILARTHCEPPEAFLITSGDMLATAPIWGQFGAWSLVRADVWLNARRMSREAAIGHLRARHGLAEPDAARLWHEAQALAPGAAGAWIARTPRFLGGSAPCDERPAVITCRNGLVLRRGPDGALRPEGAVRLVALVADGRFTLLANARGADMGAILVRDADGARTVLLSPELAGSMFVRLFFFQGAGLRFYKLFRSERQVLGSWIYTWRVEWPSRG